MEWSLTGAPLPITLRPPSPLSDEELMGMANGAQLAWMIDPYEATVTIYRPGLEPEELSRPDTVEAGAPVAGFRLTTSRLWATE